MPILWLRIALLPGWLRDKLEMRQIGMTQQDKLGDQAVSNVGAATASIKTSFDAVTSQLVEMFRDGANKRGNSSRLTQSFHFFSLSRSFLP